MVDYGMRGCWWCLHRTCSTLLWIIDTPPNPAYLLMCVRMVLNFWSNPLNKSVRRLFLLLHNHGIAIITIYPSHNIAILYIQTCTEHTTQTIYMYRFVVLYYSFTVPLFDKYHYEIMNSIENYVRMVWVLT